jgi:hypothetical protein
MPPDEEHMANGNGTDYADGDENEVYADARSRADGIETRELASQSYAGNEVVKHRLARIVGTTLADVHASTARSAHETKRLAEAAIKGNEGNATLIHNGFVRIESIFSMHIQSVEARIDTLEAAKAEAEKKEEEMPPPRHRSPDDSMVDAYEAMPADVAARVSRSQDEKRDLRARVEQLETEKRDKQLREDGAAAERARRAAEDELVAAKATAAEERWKRRIGLALGAIALLGLIASGIVAAWTFAAKHPPPAEFSPAPATK